jgi:hypothetical protein
LKISISGLGWIKSAKMIICKLKAMRLLQTEALANQAASVSTFRLFIKRNLFQKNSQKSNREHKVRKESRDSYSFVISSAGINLN